MEDRAEEEDEDALEGEIGGNIEERVDAIWSSIGRRMFRYVQVVIVVLFAFVDPKCA